MKRILFGCLAAVFLAVLGVVWQREKIAAAFFSKGSYYFNGGEYDTQKAKRFYQASLFFDSKLPKAHYQLARIYLVDGKFDVALSEINKELELYPDFKRSYYVKGLIDGYAKNYDDAVDDYDRFIEWAPREWAGYMDLSWIYLSAEKYQEAFETTERGLAYFPDNVWLNSNEGLALYKLGRYQEAKDQLWLSKKIAEKLTEDDWKTAYPGNDPANSGEGLKGMKAAISYNLSLAYAKLGEKDNFYGEYSEYSKLYPSSWRRTGPADKIWRENNPIY